LLAGEMRDHLVGIHVGAGAGAGLEDVDREVRVMPALGNFQSGFLDGPGELAVEQAEVGVGFGGGRLDEAQRADEGARHRQSRNPEVLHGALRLCAPQRVGGNLQFAHAVTLDTKALGLRGHRLLLLNAGEGSGVAGTGKLMQNTRLFRAPVSTGETADSIVSPQLFRGAHRLTESSWT